MTAGSLDEQLASEGRGLVTQPGTFLLGPTGARLWADLVEDEPGMVGRFDLVHKLNIPRLCSVRVAPDQRRQPSTVEWRPSELRMRMRLGAVELEQRITITWDDVALCAQRWSNRGSEQVTLTLETDDWVQRTEEGAAGARQPEGRGFAVAMAVAADADALWHGLVLGPGEDVEVTLAAALTAEPTLDEASAMLETCARRARAALDGGVVATAPGTPSPAASGARRDAPSSVVDAAASEYLRWFDATPRFSSDDEALDRAWHYRWFLLRHNLALPGIGSMQGLVVYEGRSHKMSKTPWRPEGWEFSKHIPLSTPMHVMDLRWHHDPALATAALAALAGRQRDDGQLASATVDETMHPYANFAGHAAAGLAELHGAELVADVLETLELQVLGEQRHLAGDDGLPVLHDHRLSGKEYQPSHWWFGAQRTGAWPRDPRVDPEYTPVKRVDTAVYQLLNARGVAAIRRALGRDPAPFDAIAARIAESIETKQWVPGLDWYADLHPDTDEPALVRSVVGVYPWWAGLGMRHVDALAATLDDPDAFATAHALPSIERRSEVYAPGGGWLGSYLKGPRGCMWNGPAWPYTNSVALDALGVATKASGHRLDGLVSRLLRSTVAMHFQRLDGRTPYLVEHYDAESGAAISDEPDYAHSYLIDVIVRHVAGLEVADHVVRVDPVDVGLGRFALEDVRVRGRRIDVRYAHDVGLELEVDGRVARRDDLGRLELEL